MKNQAPRLIGGIIISIILTLGLSISLQNLLAAWLAPTGNPPSNNIARPIHKGTESQVKDGSLGILGDLNVDLHNSSYTLKVDSTNHNVNIGRSLSIATDLGVNGSVGIGVVAPSAKLEIDMKNLTTTEGLKISRDGSNSYAYLNIENENATNNTIFKVHESGNIGIGVATPDSRIWSSSDYGNVQHLSRILDITSTISNRGVGISMHAQNQAETVIANNGEKLILSVAGATNINKQGIIFSTEENAEEFTPTERMRINAQGNVSIGTSSPSPGLKLDVEGKIGASEYCDKDGNNCKSIGMQIEKYFILNNVTDPVYNPRASCAYVNGTTTTIYINNIPIATPIESIPFSDSSEQRNQRCRCSDGYTEMGISIWGNIGGWGTCDPHGCRGIMCVKF